MKEKNECVPGRPRLVDNGGGRGSVSLSLSLPVIYIFMVKCRPGRRGIG